MNQRGPIFKIIAVMLVVAVQVIFVPPVNAQGSAIAGTIVSVAGNEPIDGAILHVGDMRTGEIYSTNKTGPDGGFVLSDLPPAAYELAVEKDGGLYAVAAPVQLASGQRRDVQVAIHAQAAADPASSAKKSKQAGGFWNNPLMAALAVIGGAFVVGAILSSADNKNEAIASPFTN